MPDFASARAHFQRFLTLPKGNRPHAKAWSGSVTLARRVSRSISRVLSRATIHLGRPSPIASSGLPGFGADHAFEPLFGLAPGGVYLAGAVARPRGALLPHPFTLTNRFRQRLNAGRVAAAVCFLLHLPWVRTPQGLPGALSCGARTFLTPRTTRGCLTDSLRSLAARATCGDSRRGRACPVPLSRRSACPARATTRVAPTIRHRGRALRSLVRIATVARCR